MLPNRYTRFGITLLQPSKTVFYVLAHNLLMVGINPILDSIMMQKVITKTTQQDEWVFEVKMVRAIKVRSYGEPYSAVANLTANGDQMFIDSHLSANNEELSKSDFMAIYKFCQSLGMKNISYDRIKNGLKSTRTLDIIENQGPKLKVC